LISFAFAGNLAMERPTEAVASTPNSLSTTFLFAPGYPCIQGAAPKRMLPLLPIKAVLTPEVFVMAIEDYVRSIAVKDSVSKDQVFRYLEMQFARADRNHDGQLDIDELRSFVGAISQPEADQR
jgi:hypothetical protein